ncbi:oxygen-independent coproporphyrinogen III oxidase [Kamptonema cortianum]|nr:oxygen-independent coproporphyrinogen III oxidase [Oscillatoria laete-virens]MDK3158015.1 oxygen-independent coproporphyrinogen III oxidase [Kamptonema cortianum]MDL5048215.1 oxygen-independent coproporphyrinogen III oxidase [Oscillatoria amoena NRMC-F 0135]MDL5053108.1 oxygen-independent coproporphyrinogen III oxidase [Oscillatoria laete-virens NRMC-F 0139]
MSDPVIPIIDGRLIAKYDQAGPRYTSYPTAPQFSQEFTSADLTREIARENAAHPDKPLSLYFHLPFCESVCFFCGCNVTFTSDRKRPAPYIDLLFREMDTVTALMSRGRQVRQLHWGGGTPTFFGPDQLLRLWAGIRGRFDFAPDAEIGLEVDPRETTTAHMDALAQAGFNRLSMGLQDFDPVVQKAVNRIQPFDITQRVIDEARERGFKSVSVDLIYGLPHQTPESFSDTVGQVLSLNPDRIALFNFAYLPEMIKHQKAIQPDALPSPAVKLDILRMAIAKFTTAGYRYIGMDHFAKPEDPMCQAQDAGTLYRNFQGYTTHKGCDLFAFGVSSISQIGHSYSQNLKNIHEYEKAIAAGGLAVQRGILLNAEDRLRHAVIMELLCHFEVSFASVEQEFQIDFPTHFSDAFTALEDMRGDGLVEWDTRKLRVTPLGRLLVRNVCMPFDTYLRKNTAAKFSRTV